MVGSISVPDALTPPSRAASVDGEHPTARPTTPAPLIFALGFATALPPASLLPLDEKYPTVHPRTSALVSVDRVSEALGRPVRMVGSGDAQLHEIDWRLDGLMVSLTAYQEVGGRHALVSLGCVRQAGAGDRGRAITGLWTLARAELTRHHSDWGRLPGLADDAFQVTYGCTAQVAWLAGDRLGTASVTDLYGEPEEVIEAARSVAILGSLCLSGA